MHLAWRLRGELSFLLEAFRLPRHIPLLDADTGVKDAGKQGAMIAC